MMKNDLIPSLYIADGTAVCSFARRTPFGSGSLTGLTAAYNESGADGLLLFDLSDTDAQHDLSISRIKEVCALAQMPVMAAGHVNRVEDVKKLLYAGCAMAILNGSKETNMAFLEEVSKRFGREKIGVCISSLEEYERHKADIEAHAGLILALEPIEGLTVISDVPVLLYTKAEEEREIMDLLGERSLAGLTGPYLSRTGLKLSDLKMKAKAAGIPMNVMVSAVPWSEFKLTENGLINVVVQDYQTNEVLMVAWMNEESYERTLLTGKMTYYSRSRQEIWLKGETSGHYQYVKSLAVDCDRDAILAKVDQIGAACHTGNRSCFFTPLAEKPCDDTNPNEVFNSVYDVIMDRKVHPKEGSYTNYLFDKGIDKILKKVGEENTEIIIAAKNPDPEEIKYEISDYLYHLMVLMVERGVTWDDVTRELARR